ncbi:hypothetical protein AB0F42_10945 [Streptomyces buecherae]|uniref:hypothetical protein n=1 Tax=Streptomyces buecherae TaxID=2763006 RepID=UPI0033F909BE
MRDLHAAPPGGGHDLMRRIAAGFGGLMIADEDNVIAETEDMLAVVRATGALGWGPVHAARPGRGVAVAR